MKSVVIYTYYRSHSSDYNLSYFAKNELSYKCDIDYIIVINGFTYNKTIEFPKLDNLTILKRENKGGDVLLAHCPSALRWAVLLQAFSLREKRE